MCPIWMLCVLPEKQGHNSRGYPFFNIPFFAELFLCVHALSDTVAILRLRLQASPLQPNAVLFRCRSCQSSAFAFLGIALPSNAFAIHRHSTPCLCLACRFNASPLLFGAVLCCAFAVQCLAFPLLSCSLHSQAVATLGLALVVLPLPCSSVKCTAVTSRSPAELRLSGQSRIS